MESALPIGSVVKLIGLRRHPSLNGSLGKVVRVHDSRCEVQMSDGSLKSVLPSNLMRVAERGDRSRTPQRDERRRRFAPETPPKVRGQHRSYRQAPGELQLHSQNFVHEQISIIDTFVPTLQRRGVEVSNRFCDTAFQWLTREQLFWNPAVGLLVIDLNPSLRAQRPWDTRTPSGRMLQGACNPCAYLAWNLAPGVTFRRAGADVSIADVFDYASDDATLQNIVRLLALGGTFIGRIVESMPTVTHVLSLGTFTSMMLKSASSKWSRSVVLISGVHPGHALRRQSLDCDACDTWTREVRGVLDNAGAFGPRAASCLHAFQNLDSCEEPLSLLSKGGGISSFSSRFAVQGVILRTHSFGHGGGSVRLCDGLGFADLKFVSTAALKFSVVRGQYGKVVRIAGVKVYRIGRNYLRYAAPGATHELVVDDPRAEVIVLDNVDSGPSL